jgi:hypothetical protein
VSEFYGETLFSSFYKYPYVFDLVHKQVKEMELDPDDIYIRKLFYTLCLPFKHLPIQGEKNIKINKKLTASGAEFGRRLSLRRKN